MAGYRLSRAAADDLENILEFGIETFGVPQATRYFDTLTQRLSDLADDPLLYPAVDDVRAGYRRSVSGAHSIYYRVEDEVVLIVRVLGRQDIQRALGGHAPED